MKKILYATTTFILCGFTAQSHAACIATPTCSSLGYTSSSSCEGGIKCPFGEAWNCDSAQKITELTTKITELEKEIDSSQSKGEDCVIGSILYSDKTCYLNPQKGKTPIGVVIYTDGSDGGQAIALNKIGKYKWIGYKYDSCSFAKDFSNYSRDYSSCANTKLIMENGTSTDYPAAWAAHEYSTEGTSVGDWCLPAAGVLASYIDNKDAIDRAFSLVKGSDFGATISSTKKEYSSPILYVWGLGYTATGYGVTKVDGATAYSVRPVLEF